jgi:hypothetical protein
VGHPQEWGLQWGKLGFTAISNAEFHPKEMGVGDIMGYNDMI